MIELENETILYEPGKVYIYKSNQHTNEKLRDKVILKMDNYNYNTKDKNIQAILYINNIDPKGTCGISAADELFRSTKRIISELKERDEMNKDNNIIRIATNKPIFTEQIQVFVNSMKDNNVSIIGIYISNFKNLEPIEYRNGISNPILYKENSVIVIKKKIKELAVELNLPIISKFRFRTGYMTLDTKSIVII